MKPKPAQLSSAEYIDWESKSPFKHEYVDGEIYAMSGATRRHNLIASNLVEHARAAGRRRGCQIFGSDMKVHVEARNSFYYPDLSVCCDPSDRHELYLVRPCFIVEIVSPSTAAIDRREKRVSYSTLASLREYAIVDQDRMRVELYRRESEDRRGSAAGDVLDDRGDYTGRPSPQRRRTATSATRSSRSNNAGYNAGSSGFCE